MSKKINFIFGIDIGTRTTIISIDNVNQADIGVSAYTYEGDARIPSLYKLNGNVPIFGEKLTSYIERGDNSIIQNFKIEFWKSNQSSRKSEQELQDWLHIICGIIKNESYDFKKCAFCFTYPAQRNILENKYLQLISNAGFPKENVLFLDEPTAATYACINKYDFFKNNEFEGKGIIVDIGAGTTDYTIVERRGVDVGPVIIDTSSTNVAGNNFSSSMINLLRKDVEKSTFKKRFSSNQITIDKIKEQFSNYYWNKDNEDLQFNTKKPEIGIFLSRDFTHFCDSIEEKWKEVDKEIDNRLKNAGITKDSLKFVICTGGGALHSGLVEFFKKKYESKFITVHNPQLIVSIGAAIYGKNRLIKNPIEKTLAISHTIASDVYLKFPEDTYQSDIYIFRESDTVSLSSDSVDEKDISLESNFFFAEGALYLHHGEYKTQIGWIDIDWEMFGESNDHPGKVEWEYDPNSKILNITVKLSNVNINSGGYSIIGEAEIYVKTTGKYIEKK